jgi:DNA-binding transcriptional ArsR family regulator
MKVTNPLDRVLDNEVKIRILRFLCKTGAKWNGRQIAREIKMSPATAHKALQALNAEGVLLLQNVGKMHIYELNEDNYLVRSMLKPLFGKEDKMADRFYNRVTSKLPV